MQSTETSALNIEITNKLNESLALLKSVDVEKIPIEEADKIDRAIQLLSTIDLKSAVGTIASALYSIVITGPIGVGKTTTYNKVLEYLESLGYQVITIREYIDGPWSTLSQALLEKYLAGEMTDDMFQNYIQCHYINSFSNCVKPDKKCIFLFERCMSDSIAIFCNNANKNGKLNDLAFTLMYRNCINVDSEHGAPNYFLKNFDFSKIKTDTTDETLESIKQIINNDIKNGIHNRVIGLYNDANVCFDRIQKRSRNGESSYSLDFLKMNCGAYDKLYDMIMSDDYDRISLFDLGKLYHRD